jgi:proline iminopeptidase
VQQQEQLQQLLQAGLQHAGSKGMSQGTTQALLTSHYSMHGAFLLEEPLLAHMHHINGRQFPCIAVQGQQDLICPPGTAFDLHQAWPDMELRLVPGAGHSMYDPAITHELVCATDRMLQLL